MTTYVALLRAVNVGGTGKLPMAELIRLCEGAGCRDVRTYIASGNVVFACDRSEAEVKATLEAALQGYAGKPVAVLVRTAAELAEVLAANPFPDTEARFTAIFFLDTPPPADALDDVAGCADEELRLGRREIYVRYPSGMGQSKLRIPAAKAGTARNINTVTKLVEIARRSD